jgi:hypothetical protein
MNHSNDCVTTLILKALDVRFAVHELFLSAVENKEYDEKQGKDVGGRWRFYVLCFLLFAGIPD